MAARLLARAFAAGMMIVSLGTDGGAVSGGPRVEILSPTDGRAVHADELRIRASVSVGPGVGRVWRVDLTVDGRLVERIEPMACRRGIVDFRMPLGALAAGAHTIGVTAHRRVGPAAAERTTANVTITVDRTLPLAESNPAEDVMTPELYACFSVRAGPYPWAALETEPGADDEDDGEDRTWRRPERLHVGGTLVPGLQTDGIDLTRDRIIIGLSRRGQSQGEVAVIDPDELQCRERSSRGVRCRFVDPDHPVLRAVRIEERRGRWHFEIDGAAGSLPYDAFYLRIGNDWGGIDLNTGDRITGLRLDEDLARRKVTTIGPAGGRIEATDAGGVLIRLDVPQGALTRETLITLTPLATSPLMDGSTSLHPGVTFEPEGLTFAVPARLTLDLTRTGQPVDQSHFVFLMVSPTTTMPLFRTPGAAAGTLTALLPHFSSTTAGPTGPLGVGWAELDKLVKKSGPWPLSTISTVSGFLSLLNEKLAKGELEGLTQEQVLDMMAIVTARALESLVVHIEAESALITSAPARLGGFERLLELEAMRASFGESGFISLAAMRINIEARILALSAMSEEPPLSPAARYTQLMLLADTASLLGQDDLQGLAITKAREFIRSFLEPARERCQTDPDSMLTAAALAQLQLFASDAIIVFNDPDLPADVQALVETCGKVPPFTIQASGTSVESLVYDDDERLVCCDPVTLGTDTAPPVSLNSNGQLQVTAPSLQELAIDFDGTGSESSTTDASRMDWARVRAAITVERASTITIAIHESWFQSGRVEVAWMLDSGEQGRCEKDGSPMGGNVFRCGPGGNSLAIPVAEGSTRTLDVFLSVGGGGADNSRGSGRALTVTITPAPEGPAGS